MVWAVLDWPVPARTGMRPATVSTAVRRSRSYSGPCSEAASPVEPATTTALVPASSCCSSSRRQASRSISPATVNGVASAVMLPESCKPKSLGGRQRSYLRLQSTGKYAGHAPGAARGCDSCCNTPISADAALTESDPAPRPAPNENHLIINAYTTHPQSPLLAVSRRIADSGCNLVDARLSTVGRDVSVTALAICSCVAVAKLEHMQKLLNLEEGMKLVWYRTSPKAMQSNLLPYIVEVIAADKPGIQFQLADFFDRQGITIESLHSSRYQAMQTGADM